MKNQKLNSANYATFWQRVIAFTSDILLLIAFSYLLKFIIESNGWRSIKEYDFWNKLDAYELFGWMFLYYPLADKFGGTVGKKIIKIQCVDLVSYGQISCMQAYIRIVVAYGIWVIAFFFSGYFINMTSSMLFPFYLPMLVSLLNLISILFSEKNQGWHDKLAKVVIVKNN